MLSRDGIVLSVLNDGPDPVTIAQVTVDDAFWAFTADGGGTTLAPSGSHVDSRFPIRGSPGEAHLVKLLTSTGTTFEHEIAVAVSAPKAEAANLGLFTLIGLYVGVIPVALGLLWFPLVSRLGRTGLDALLALDRRPARVPARRRGQGRARSCRRRCPARIRAWRCSSRLARGAYLALETFGAWLQSAA